MSKDDDEDNAANIGVGRYPCMPSLVALQQMRNRLHLAFLGKKLMNWTALATGRELRKVAAEMNESYGDFAEELANCYILIARCRFYYPMLNKMVLEDMQKEAHISVASTVKAVSAGVRCVSYEILESEKPPYLHMGIDRGGQTIKETKIAWANLLKRMIIMLQLRNSFRSLDDANRASTKKSNVLGKLIVPKLLATIKYIMSELEELEREDNFRLKTFKKNKLRIMAAKGKAVCTCCHSFFESKSFKEIDKDNIKCPKCAKATEISRKVEVCANVGDQVMKFLEEHKDEINEWAKSTNVLAKPCCILEDSAAVPAGSCMPVPETIDISFMGKVETEPCVCVVPDTEIKIEPCVECKLEKPIERDVEEKEEEPLPCLTEKPIEKDVEEKEEEPLPCLTEKPIVETEPCGPEPCVCVVPDTEIKIEPCVECKLEKPIEKDVEEKEEEPFPCLTCREDLFTLENESEPCLTCETLRRELKQIAQEELKQIAQEELKQNAQEDLLPCPTCELENMAKREAESLHKICLPCKVEKMDEQNKKSCVACQVERKYFEERLKKCIPCRVEELRKDGAEMYPPYEGDEENGPCSCKSEKTSVKEPDGNNKIQLYLKEVPCTKCTSTSKTESLAPCPSEEKMKAILCQKSSCKQINPPCMTKKSAEIKTSVWSDESAMVKICPCGKKPTRSPFKVMRDEKCDCGEEKSCLRKSVENNDPCYIDSNITFQKVCKGPCPGSKKKDIPPSSNKGSISKVQVKLSRLGRTHSGESRKLPSHEGSHKRKNKDPSYKGHSPCPDKDKSSEKGPCYELKVPCTRTREPGKIPSSESIPYCNFCNTRHIPLSEMSGTLKESKSSCVGLMPRTEGSSDKKQNKDPCYTNASPRTAFEDVDVGIVPYQNMSKTKMSNHKTLKKEKPCSTKASAETPYSAKNKEEKTFLIRKPCTSNNPSPSISFKVTLAKTASEIMPCKGLCTKTEKLAKFIPSTSPCKVKNKDTIPCRKDLGEFTLKSYVNEPLSPSISPPEVFPKPRNKDAICHKPMSETAIETTKLSKNFESVRTQIREALSYLTESKASFDTDTLPLNYTTDTSISCLQSGKKMGKKSKNDRGEIIKKTITIKRTINPDGSVDEEKKIVIKTKVLHTDSVETVSLGSNTDNIEYTTLQTYSDPSRSVSRAKYMPPFCSCQNFQDAECQKECIMHKNVEMSTCERSKNPANTEEKKDLNRNTTTSTITDYPDVKYQACLKPADKKGLDVKSDKCKLSSQMCDPQMRSCISENVIYTLSEHESDGVFVVCSNTTDQLPFKSEVIRTARNQMNDPNYKKQNEDSISLKSAKIENTKATKDKKPARSQNFKTAFVSMEKSTNNELFDKALTANPNNSKVLLTKPNESKENIRVHSIKVNLEFKYLNDKILDLSRKTHSESIIEKKEEDKKSFETKQSISSNAVKPGQAMCRECLMELSGYIPPRTDFQKFSPDCKYCQMKIKKQLAQKRKSVTSPDSKSTSFHSCTSLSYRSFSHICVDLASSYVSIKVKKSSCTPINEESPFDDMEPVQDCSSRKRNKANTTSNNENFLETKKIVSVEGSRTIELVHKAGQELPVDCLLSDLYKDMSAVQKLNSSQWGPLFSSSCDTDRPVEKTTEQKGSQGKCNQCRRVHSMEQISCTSHLPRQEDSKSLNEYKKVYEFRNLLLYDKNSCTISPDLSASAHSSNESSIDKNIQCGGLCSTSPCNKNARFALQDTFDKINQNKERFCYGYQRPKKRNSKCNLVESSLYRRVRENDPTVYKHITTETESKCNNCCKSRPARRLLCPTLPKSSSECLKPTCCDKSSSTVKSKTTTNKDSGCNTQQSCKKVATKNIILQIGKKPAPCSQNACSSTSADATTCTKRSAKYDVRSLSNFPKLVRKTISIPKMRNVNGSCSYHDVQTSTRNTMKWVKICKSLSDVSPSSYYIIDCCRPAACCRPVPCRKVPPCWYADFCG